MGIQPLARWAVEGICSLQIFGTFDRTIEVDSGAEITGHVFLVGVLQICQTSIEDAGMHTLSHF